MTAVLDFAAQPTPAQSAPARRLRALGTGPRDDAPSAPSLSHQLLVRAAAETSPEARKELQDRVVVLNQQVAANIASRYRQRGLDAEDLGQVAALALVKAVRGYRPDRGRDFLSFAVPTIRGEIRRHFRDHGWLVRPPRHLQEVQLQLRAAEGSLTQRLARRPTAAETATELQLKVSDVRDAELARGCFHATSLDAPVSPGFTDTVADRLSHLDPELEAVENRIALQPLLAGLTARERSILTMRFVDGRTQKDIGAVIGVSQMQVSRLLTGILAKLRGQLCA